MTIKEKIRNKILKAGDAFRIDWPGDTRQSILVYVYSIVKDDVAYPIRVIEIGSYEDAMFNGYYYGTEGLRFAHNIDAGIVKTDFFNAIFSNKFAKHTWR